MKVGFVTIGQSPRVDITRDIDPILKDAGIEYIECGALDNLSKDEVQTLKPESPNDYILVTRLRDGSEVKLSKTKIIPLMQNCIAKLEPQVDIIGLLCTGEFPELKSNKLIIEPSVLLSKLVEAISPPSLVIIIPSSDQIEIVKRKWNIKDSNSIIPISPYTSTLTDFKAKIEKVKDKEYVKEAQLVVMDCMGYSVEMKKIVKDILGKLVILPRTLLARVLVEMSM